MAIMSVNRPEATPQKERKEDDFDRLIKGLQIAQSITGIATNYHQIQASKLQQQRMEQELKSGDISLKKQQALEAGQITPDMELQITPMPAETPGARKGILSRTGEQIWFKTPQDVQIDQTVLKQQHEKYIKDLEKAAANAKNAQELSLKFGEQTEQHQTTKNLAARYDAFNGIKRSAESANPASDIALIFQYMRMLDPGSTVREGEFATAQNAASIPDQVRNQYNRALEGTRLTPEQRINMVNTAEGILYENAMAYRKTVAEPAIAKANQYGGNPAIVVNPAWMQIAADLEAKFAKNVQQQSPSQNVSGSQNMSIMPQAQAGSARDDLADYIKNIPDENKAKGIIPIKANAPRR